MKRPTTMTAQYDARASSGVSSCLGALAAESISGAASAVTVGGFVVVSAISLCCDFGCDRPAQRTTRRMRFDRAKSIKSILNTVAESTTRERGGIGGLRLGRGF